MPGGSPPAPAHAPPASAAPAGKHRQCCRGGVRGHAASSAEWRVPQGGRMGGSNTQLGSSLPDSKAQHVASRHDMHSTAQHSTAQHSAACHPYMAALYRIYMTVGLKAHTRPLVRASSADTGEESKRRASAHGSLGACTLSCLQLVWCGASCSGAQQHHEQSTSPSPTARTRVGQRQGGGSGADVVAVGGKHSPLLLVVVGQRVQQAPQRGVKAPGKQGRERGRVGG